MFGEAIGQAVGAILGIDVGTLIAAGIGIYAIKYIWDYINTKK